MIKYAYLVCFVIQLGSAIRLTSAERMDRQAQPSCSVGDKTININQTSVEGTLVFLCSSSGVQAIGCVFPDEKGSAIPVKVGETVRVGNVSRRCLGLTGPGASSDTGIISPASSPSSSSDSSCTHEGKQHQLSEIWTVGHFRYTCQSGGAIGIVACVIDKSNELEVDKAVVKFGLLHRCFKEGNRVFYRSYICGADAKCDAGSIAVLNAGGAGSGQTSPGALGPDASGSSGNATASVP